MDNSRITVVLVEDHKVVRKGLKTLLELEHDIVVVGEAETGVDAVKLIKRLRPMIVLMDIALPKLNGIEATRQILNEKPKTKILVLSAYGDDSYIMKLMDLGISGFLMKHCSPDFLIRAIREIKNGSQFFSPAIYERIGCLTHKDPKRDGLSNHGHVSLSEREAQVLQLVAEGNGNKQIAYDLQISIKTVEKHRQNLMKKLSIHDTAGLTRYAIAEGIIESSIHFSDR